MVLYANDGQQGDYFGCAVALTGNTAVVGACGDDVGGNVDAHLHGAFNVLGQNVLSVAIAKQFVQRGGPLRFDPVHGVPQLRQLCDHDVLIALHRENILLEAAAKAARAYSRSS